MDKTPFLRLILLCLIAISPLVFLKAQVDKPSKTDIENASNLTSPFICVDEAFLTKEIAAPRGLVFSSVLWNVGETITVKFLNGSTLLQDTVKHYARQWEKHANVHFQFIESGNAKIRITFKENNLVSWSYIGTRAKYVPQHKPTMLLAFAESTNETTLNRITLHEFGHALGLLHEHQHPEHDIQWNEPAVYDYYRQVGWSDGLIDYYIFNKYSTSVTQFCEHDTASIMHYPIPNSFTLNDYQVGVNTTLSGADIFFIQQLYPFETNRNLDSLCIPAIEKDSALVDSTSIIPSTPISSLTTNFSISNQPNPFSTGTTLSFHLSENSLMELVLFNTEGQIVYEQKEILEKGLQQLYLKETLFAQAGIYFYSLKINDTLKMGKLMKL